jgi:spermidine synthase
MVVIIEKSDPNKPIEYSGTLLASGNSVQEWSILQEESGNELLFIDNQLQSSKDDEAIYHEFFVHSLMIGSKKGSKVLILGGSEGCMLREVLKWDIESVTQVDWDKSLVEYFKNNTSWNSNSYDDPRVNVVISDALQWLRDCTMKFDCIFIDLLDPKLDNMTFFYYIITECKKCLEYGGMLSCNAGPLIPETSMYSLALFIKILFKDNSFAAIYASVPSFKDDWCFLMVTSKFWNLRIADNILPESLTHFTKMSFVKSTNLPSYVSPFIRDFWMDSKKLTADSYDSNVEFKGNYGC